MPSGRAADRVGKVGQGPYAMSSVEAGDFLPIHMMGARFSDNFPPFAPHRS